MWAICRWTSWNRAAKLLVRNSSISAAGPIVRHADNLYGGGPMNLPLRKTEQTSNSTGWISWPNV